ncbi:uncharacterized protein LOC128270463 [Anopheles cruzii]|uniref:uncharacterized protein LOC128270463 n=1 Tax=Anopheles cruzii TaxID=68878 RepID=UPI0022EC29D1|nr:uncharacterized protein LOC128270463 [Anopheles cruzii]
MAPPKVINPEAGSGSRLPTVRVLRSAASSANPKNSERGTSATDLERDGAREADEEAEAFADAESESVNAPETAAGSSRHGDYEPQTAAQLAQPPASCAACEVNAREIEVLKEARRRKQQLLRQQEQEQPRRPQPEQQRQVQTRPQSQPQRREPQGELQGRDPRERGQQQQERRTQQTGEPRQGPESPRPAASQQQAQGWSVHLGRRDLQRQKSLRRREEQPHQRQPPPTRRSRPDVVRDTGGIRPSLTPPYRGPYTVERRDAKYFVINVNGKSTAVSIDRLKPCYQAEPSDDISSDETPSDNTAASDSGSASNEATTSRPTTPPSRPKRSRTFWRHLGAKLGANN